MRVVRSILALPAVRRPPICLTRLAVASHRRPCSRAHSSSLAVEPGYSQDLEHLFKQPSTPSNNTPNQNSSEDGKFLRSLAYLFLNTFLGRSPNATTAIPETYKHGSAAWRRPPDPYHPETTGLARQTTPLRSATYTPSIAKYFTGTHLQSSTVDIKQQLSSSRYPGSSAAAHLSLHLLQHRPLRVYIFTAMLELERQCSWTCSSRLSHLP